MRCGRLLVEGEAEDSPISPRSPKSCKVKQKPKSGHDQGGKKSNPYSSRGLDKFATLSAELSAKREYVARKVGAPEAQVRFAYSSKGWIPVVVKTNGGGEGHPEVSILPPIRTKSRRIKEKEEEEQRRRKNEEEMEKGCENSGNGESSQSVVGAPWSGYLRTTAFGVLTVSAILVRKSAAPAAAMAVVMLIGSLQRRWQGGVMCMKKFVFAGISYFSQLLLQWKGSVGPGSPNPIRAHPPPEGDQPQQPIPKPQPQPQTSGEGGEQKQKGGILPLSAPSSPVGGHLAQKRKATVFSKSQELKTQKQEQKNNRTKDYARIMSLDGQARKPIRIKQSESFNSRFQQSESCNRRFQQSESFNGRVQQSESFNRRRKRGRVGFIDPIVGATVMIILLFCLVFYGKLCAIFFTSAWWYLLPRLRTEGIPTHVSRSGDKTDLQSWEYRKKVVMDGLLDRNHNHGRQQS